MQIFTLALRARLKVTVARVLVVTVAAILAGCGTPETPSGSATAVASPTPVASPLPSTPPPALVTPAPTPIESVPTLPPGSLEPPPYLPPPCGEADPTCTSLLVQLQQDIDFTEPVPCGVDRVVCFLRMDSFVLQGGSDRPIVVMIPGGPLPPGNRETLWPLARYVAGRGAVVFTADYRSSPTYGGGYPSTFADVACAIRFARSRGAELGGDPARVTLVAHSFGGFPGAVVTFSSKDYGPDEPACLEKSGSGRPDAFAGVAGIYTLDRIGQDFLADFLGGDRSTAASAWAAADAQRLIAAGGGASSLVRLIVGSEDRIAPLTAAEELASVLRDEQRDIEVTTIPTGTHDSVLRDVSTVDVISELDAGE